VADNWYMLGHLEELAGTLAEQPQAEKAGRLLAALSSNVSDALTSAAKRASLDEGAHRASALLDRLRATYDVDEASPSYLAGRLATVVDVLAMIVRARAADELPEIARSELKTLQALYVHPLSNKALAEERHVTEEAACRSLRECRKLDLVETEKVGRENRNRLTSLGQALFDDGLLPISEEEKSYDMKRVLRMAPGGSLAKRSDLPQLSL